MHPGIDPAWTVGLRTMRRSGRIAYLHAVDADGHRGGAEVNVDHVLAGVQVTGVSWEDADSRLGFPHGTVNAWAVGWETPTHADLLHLAEAAQLPVDFFYWPATSTENELNREDEPRGGQLDDGGGGATIIAFPVRPGADLSPSQPALF